MRIELRDKPEEKREPRCKLWLDNGTCGEILLQYQIEGTEVDTLAYFSDCSNIFHVFKADIDKIGYVLQQNS